MDSSDQYISWKSSPPGSPKNDPASEFSLETPARAPTSKPPSSAGLDLQDPISDLLDKYQPTNVHSSPPPTWPAPNPPRAQRQLSEVPKPSSNGLRRLYSPGYLKRTRPALPSQIRPVKKNPVEMLELDSSDDDFDLTSFAPKTAPKTAPSKLAFAPDLPIDPARKTMSVPAAAVDGTRAADTDAADGAPVKASKKFSIELSSDDDWDFKPAVRAKTMPTTPTKAKLFVQSPFKSPSKKAVGNLDAPVLKQEHASLVIYPMNPRVHRYFVDDLEYLDSATVLKTHSIHGEATIHLRQSWANADVDKGDIIHVIGEYDAAQTEVNVDNRNNLLVVLPDSLVTCTSIAEAYNCDRQVVLRQRLRMPGDLAEPMVYGTIIHELVQRQLKAMDLSHASLEKTLKELVTTVFIEELSIVKTTVEKAFRDLCEKLPPIVTWAAQFVGTGTPTGTAAVHRSSRKLAVTVTECLDFEEEIWSPMYGLKGKIDVSARVATSEPAKGTGNAAPKTRSALEIKTGKSTTAMSHRAQIALYSLLLDQKYSDVAPELFLYYTQTGEMIAVPALPDEIRGLIQKRNSLARYFFNPGQLPNHTPDSFACKYCNRREVCGVYTVARNETAETNSERPVYSTALDRQKEAAGLTDKQIDFFRFWEKLIMYEDQETSQTTKDIWCKSGSEGEDSNQCIAGLTVELIEKTSDGIGWKTLYRGRRPKQPGEEGKFASNSRLYISSLVVVSSQNQVAVSQGYLRKFEETGDEFIVEFTSRSLLDETATYRLDHDEFVQFMAMSRYNLLRLFTEDGSRLRKLVVDLEAPRFDTHLAVKVPDHFNSDQKHAIETVMKAQDYTLILGMPGTGKTTTIVSIIEMLVAQGKSVLVSGYTHSAVDNIVLKLIKDGQDLLRLGSVLKVHPDVVPMLAGHGKKAQSQADLEQLYLNVPVVATTSLGINNWLFTRRRFDYCILDEASQLTLPACLGPLRFADKFVLVGDHHQLQPLVRNPTARQYGFNISLFKRLCQAHPNAVVSLTQQYRMSKDIMQLSSMLVYEGRLRCGNEQVAEQRLVLPHPPENPLAWMKPALDPANNVVFLNTDTLPSLEEEVSDGIINPGEAKLIEGMVDAFSKAGVSMTSMGVISVYRAQLRLLQRSLADRAGLEILTADQAQGRDKDCIIISLVRSNKEQKVGDLLRDWRRLNVTFTRAKSKLIIVGSRRTLTYAPALERFLTVIETNGWSYSV